MPIPFIIAGVSVISTIIAIKKAYDDNKDAKDTNALAKNIISESETKLKKVGEQINSIMEGYGVLKFNIINNDVEKFLAFMKENKKTVLGLENIEELVKDLNVLVITKNIVIKAMRELNPDFDPKTLVGGAIVGSLSGALAGFGAYGATMAFGAASTGTAISTLSGVAAYNATMAALGGGALAAGGGGMALGTLVLGSLTLGAGFLVGGLALAFAASKKKNDAYDNFTKAREYEVEADKICKEQLVVANIIKDLAESLSKLIDVFNIELGIAKRYKKNKNIFNVLFKRDIKQIGIVCQLMTAIKSTLLIDVLTKDGELNRDQLEAMMTSNNTLIASLND